MLRREAIALLKEVGNHELVQPTMVVVQQEKSDRYQLKIKGEYDTILIQKFLNNRRFSYKIQQDYLIIFKSWTKLSE